MRGAAIGEWLLERGGLVALATLALLTWLAPPHIVGGDNAELVTAAAVGGVPHPSGYPLYLVWLRLTPWLPGATAAQVAAVSTAILGAASMLVLHAACRAWGARPTSSTFAVALYAASPVVLRLYSAAEVFALNALVVACVLWLSARAGPVRGMRRVAILGLVAGLGLSNHLTCVLVAPIGILGVVRGLTEVPGGKRRAAAAVLGLFALVVGLAPYAYLMVTPETAISWRPIEDLPGLVRHALRLDYGGVGTFSPGRPSVPAAESLAALAAMVGRTWLWLPLAAALAVLAIRSTRRARVAGEDRVAWVTLSIAVLASGPMLASRFNVPPHGIGLAIVHRFHLLPAMLLAIPVAVAVDEVWAFVSRARTTQGTTIRSLQRWTPVLVLGGFVALASRSLPRHSPAVERAVFNMLAPLPPAAVVLVSEDDLYFGSVYAQLVLGVRPDVTVISSGQLFNPDYRRRLQRSRRIAGLDAGDRMPSLTVAADVLAHGRPLFVDSTRANIVKRYPSFPQGTLLRVLPRDTPIPDPDDVHDMNRNIFATLDLAYPRPSIDDDYAAHVHERYAYLWRLQARVLRAHGFAERAAFAEALADTLEPTR